MHTLARHPNIYARITEINLSNNNLSDLSVAQLKLSMAPSLRLLNLSNNALALPPNLLGANVRLRVEVANNPFTPASVATLKYLSPRFNLNYDPGSTGELDAEKLRDHFKQIRTDYFNGPYFTRLVLDCYKMSVGVRVLANAQSLSGGIPVPEDKLPASILQNMDILSDFKRIIAYHTEIFSQAFNTAPAIDSQVWLNFRVNELPLIVNRAKEHAEQILQNVAHSALIDQVANRIIAERNLATGKDTGNTISLV